MRRLESQHLPALAQDPLDLRERRAAAGGDDELARLVRDDAGVTAHVEDLALPRLTVEILAAAAAQAERPARARGLANAGGNFLEGGIHSAARLQSKEKPRIAFTVQLSLAEVRPRPTPKFSDHDLRSSSVTRYSVRSCSARGRRLASVPMPS